MMRLALAASASLVLACAGTADPPDSPPLSALSRVDREPAGANCLSGGSAIRTGLDGNRDGVLEDAEVTSVAYACVDPSATVVLRQDAEPAGANCAAGGTALHAGIDANGNGVLDDPEIAKTSYACGVPPASPPVTLTRSVQVAPPTPCPAGGTRIEAGPDLDGDGVLDDLEVRASVVVCGVGPVLTRSRAEWLAACGGYGAVVESGLDADLDGTLEDEEVTATSRVCGETASLPYAVSTADDVAFLQGVKRIRGSLVVQGSQLQSIVLWLEVVDGDVEVSQNPSLESFGLTIGLLGGSVRISENPELEFVRIEPAIGKGYGGLRVPGDVVVESNPKLETPLHAGDLGWVAGSLVVRDNDVLQFYDALKELRFVGGEVVVERNGALHYLDLPALAWVLLDFTVRDNPALCDLNGLDAALGLKHVGGRLEVSGNSSLRDVQRLGVETVGGIDLSNNPALLRLWLPEVHEVTGDVVVSGDTGSPWFADGPLIIDGSLVVAGTALDALELLPLVQVGGDLRVLGNANLLSFSLPALAQVRGDVLIEDNAVLPGVAAPALAALERATSLVVDRNALLTELALPSLASVYSWIEVRDNPNLPTCQARALVAQLPYPPPVSIGGNDDAASCP